MKILTARQMREVDRISIEQLGIPSLTLMENAGQNVFRVMERKFPSLDRERVAVLCGKGNNGGDGFVVARLIRERTPHNPPCVILLAAPEALQGDALANYRRYHETGGNVSIARDAKEWEAARRELDSATLIVDAILGTGLDGAVRGFLLEVIRDVNARCALVPIVVVDMPSGMPSDTGAALGESLSARYSVTFTAPKWSHVFPPNSERVGELFVTPIGTPPSVYENDPSIYMNLITNDDFAWVGAKRQQETHKGTYGHALVVAGSRGKSGAAALAGLGALRAGAGLVTVATASSVWTSVAAASPALMTEPLAETEDGTISLGAFDYGRFEIIAAEKSVIAIGPGLSTHPSTVAFARRVVKESARVAVVIDADGLNAFAGAAELLDGNGRRLILTPHPGEMARLAGLSTKQVQENRVDVAREFAGRHKVYLILKGYRTLVAAPDGQVYVNPTGNPGMATAGTGDVLTGIIAGLLAQHPGVEVEKVLSAAVYWHGAAGDAAAAKVGEVPLIATDMLEAMPEALRAACAATTSEGGVA
jgi:ADP-dependent NAD(P)H-hydrate dehydratase / NAD(P)H-hydrate epimerase